MDIAIPLKAILGGWIGWKIGKRTHLKARKETLANPLKRFEWRLAKAVEAFNESVWAFNHLLSGHNLGQVQEDETELVSKHNLLSQSRETLARGKEMYEWMKNDKQMSSLSLEPKLAPLLAELAEAECDLQEHLTKLKDGSEKAKQLLENETAFIELAHEEVHKLLAEKT